MRRTLLLVLGLVAGRPENEPGGDPATRTALHVAAREGNVAAVQQLIRQGALLEARDETDKLRTPLHVAAHHEHATVVELLLGAGAPVNAGEIDDWKPLHEVCHNGNRKIAEILLTAGADMQAHASGGWSGLHQAAGNANSLSVLQLLLERGALVDEASDDEEITPLHVAVQRGRLAAAAMLLQHGASPNAAMKSGGMTPLHMAAALGQIPLLQTLLAHGASVASVDQQGNTALALAEGIGHAEGAELLRAAASSSRCSTPDMAAALVWTIPARCTVIALSRGGIGDAGAELLSHALLRGGFAPAELTLELSFNNLSDAAAASLAVALEVTDAVGRLELAGNTIGPEGAASLSQALLESPGQLRYLELSGNRLGDAGASALAEALAQSRSLELVGLHANQIGDQGAEALAAALKPGSELAYVGLNANVIGDSGAFALAVAVQRSHSLRTLKLDNNRVGDAGAAALAAAVAAKDAFETLRLVGNRIGAAGVTALESARGRAPHATFAFDEGGATPSTNPTQPAGGAGGAAQGGGAVGILTEGDAARLMESGELVVVKWDTEACVDCAKLDPIWETLGAQLRGAVWRVSCAEQRAWCEAHGVRVESRMPAFEVWGRLGVERYEGPPNLQALLNFIKERWQSWQFAGGAAQLSDPQASKAGREAAKVRREATKVRREAAEKPPDETAQMRPPEQLDQVGLEQVRTSQRPVLVRFDWPDAGGGCVACERLDDLWTRFASSLPLGSVYVARCGDTPEVCAECGAQRHHPEEATNPAAHVEIKAWTGEQFEPYGGVIAPQQIHEWVTAYADWDLDVTGTGRVANSELHSYAVDAGGDVADGAASHEAPPLPSPGRIEPWTGQALPTQVFVPTAPLTGDNGLRPMVVVFHGGNDGPFEVGVQQGLAMFLNEDPSYAASWPYVTLWPCTQCSRDGKMAPHGNALYKEGRPEIGQMGFTPRQLLRVDRVIDAALHQFGGDPQRIILSSSSYGGRGLYWYAAGRPHVFAALVPMAASISPTPLLAEGVCCASGERSCCPPVWHVVGANDKPLMVWQHDEWDRTLRAQPQRTTEVKYTKYEWAPPPRQKEYSYMTGHAPYDLAWAPNNTALFEWLRDQHCAGCRGPSLTPPVGPDVTWKRSVSPDGWAS